MFRSHNDLCDVVSVLPYCEANDAFLFAFSDRNAGYWIPSKKVISNKQWKRVAKEIVDELFYDVDVKKVCKLVRVWKPPEKGQIHHVVFAANVLKEKQKRDTFHLKYKVLWANVDEIQDIYAKLRSPEMLDFMSVVKNVSMQRPPLRGESLNPEGVWSKLIDDNPLNEVVEIMENHVFPDISSSGYQKLLDSAEFTKAVQVGIFVQYLVHCFPCTYMNIKTFVTILHSMGWDEKTATKLFHTADVSTRGFLSYRDFLYIMAVVDPKTQHGGVTGEIRSRYIFRHYDRNNDKILDQGEMKVLVEDVLRVKKKSSLKTVEDVCPLMISGGCDHTTNMNNFLELVGNMKLRGTSLLLRSSTSVTSDFPLLKEEIKFIKSVPEISVGVETVTTRMVTLFPCSSGESGLMPFSEEQTKQGRNYAVEIHCVKLTDGGSVVDIDKVTVGSDISIVSSPRHSLVEVLNDYSRNPFHAAQSEVLRSLQFFAQEISFGETTQSPKSNAKPRFNWGYFDLSSLAQNLLKVCEGVTAVLKKEPRLVQLKPPVCAVGDLHGRFPDLTQLEKCFWNLGPVLSPTSLLFLGDYVDKGPHGVEVIAYLLAHKLSSPSKIALLRGTHEIRVVQRSFYNQCIKRFGDPLGKEVWEAVNDAMDCLPLAAIVAGKVFCCHGGIPPPWLCPVVSTINSIPCPLPQPDEQSPLAWELLWNEPLRKSDLTQSLEVELRAKEGFAVNPLKGTGHLFNASALRKFLSGNRLSLLLRAHERNDMEFSAELGRLMLTLCSAFPRSDEHKDSACVLVYAGKDRSLDLQLSQRIPS